MDKMKEAVETLTQKAANAPDSNEAMRFSQAALNTAHARRMLVEDLPETRRRLD